MSYRIESFLPLIQSQTEEYIFFSDAGEIYALQKNEAFTLKKETVLEAANQAYSDGTRLGGVRLIILPGHVSGEEAFILKGTSSRPRRIYLSAVDRETALQREFREISQFLNQLEQFVQISFKDELLRLLSRQTIVNRLIEILKHETGHLLLRDKFGLDIFDWDSDDWEVQFSEYARLLRARRIRVKDAEHLSEIIVEDYRLSLSGYLARPSTETAVYDFVNPDLAEQARQQIRRFLEE